MPALALLCALVVAGCGGSQQNSNGARAAAVAGVDNGVISRADVDHWMTVLAKMEQPPGSTGQVQVPNDPPQFARCVSQIQANTAKLPEGLRPSQPQTADTLREQCRERYTTLKALALQFLIEARWVQGEAAAKHVRVGPADVQRQVRAAMQQQALRTPGDLNRYLAKWDMARSDFMYRARVIAFTDKLRAQQVVGVPDVTGAQISAYYKANTGQFAHPELRDVDLVEAKSEADARAAIRAVSGGATFASVAARYSIQASSRAAGGRVTGMAKGNGDPALDAAIFSATRPGVLSGPVHGRVGWFVFRLLKVSPPASPNLQTARPRIRQLLIGQEQQKRVNAFVDQLRNAWVTRTTCSPGFVVQDCKNANRK